MLRTGLAFLTLALFELTSGASTVELISGVTPTTRISAQGDSRGPIYSADGQFVLFSSDAPDIASGAVGPRNLNLYMLTTASGAVELISAAAGGLAANGASSGPQVSSDNRYVVFQSMATNLVDGDGNGSIDIFLRDRTAGITTLISHNLGATDSANGQSEFPEISADGEWVVFQSAATNLVANDANLSSDLFAWKKSDGSVRLVTEGFNGKSLAGSPLQFSLTPDGHSVLFAYNGTNLVVPNKTTQGEVYLRDLEAGTTKWVSAAVTNLAAQGYTYSGNPVMSRNGRYVFLVAAKTLGTSGGLMRVDLTDDSIILVDAINTGALTTEDFYGPSVSDDGEAAVYITRDSKLYYWKSGATATVQLDVSATDTVGASDTPVISGDGKKVVYSSAASGIISGVDNGAPQLYLHDMESGETRLITHNAAGAATFGNDAAYPVFSPDYSTVVFESESDELVDGDKNQRADVFSYKIADGSLSLLSVSKTLAPSVTAVGASNIGRDSITADNRFVLFRSLARLNPMDTNSSSDLYVFDRVAKTNILITAGTNGYSIPNVSFGTAILTRDGTKVIFQGNSPGLAGPTDLYGGVYIRDLQTGTLTNLARGTLLQVSGNGRFIYYMSSPVAELRRYDLSDGSQIANSITLSSALYPVASDSGDRIVYQSGGLFMRDYSQPDKVAIWPSNPNPVLLSADGSTLVAITGNLVAATNFLTGETNLYGPFTTPAKLSMSADAQIVAFQTKSVTSGGPSEVHVLDRSTGNETLISHPPGSATNGNGDSDSPVVSLDGRLVAFESWASDLVPNDTNGFKDVFIYDRQSGQITVASAASGGSATANSMSVNAVFSPDSSLLAFVSVGSDLVAADMNDSADVFALDLSAAAMTDSDGDGLDDAWEMATFSTLQYGASDDPDGDGATNLQEFRAGTNAKDSASVFKIESLLANTDGSNHLTWKGASNHTYRVEFKAALDAADWTTIGSDVSGSAGGVNSIDLAGGAQGFYRLRLIQ